MNLRIHGAAWNPQRQGLEQDSHNGLEWPFLSQRVIVNFGSRTTIRLNLASFVVKAPRNSRIRDLNLSENRLPIGTPRIWLGEIVYPSPSTSQSHHFPYENGRFWGTHGTWPVLFLSKYCHFGSILSNIQLVGSIPCLKKKRFGWLYAFLLGYDFIILSPQYKSQSWHMPFWKESPYHPLFRSFPQISYYCNSNPVPQISNTPQMVANTCKYPIIGGRDSYGFISFYLCPALSLGLGTFRLLCPWLRHSASPNEMAVFFFVGYAKIRCFIIICPVKMWYTRYSPV